MYIPSNGISRKKQIRIVFFTMTAEILARSLANFYCVISGQTHEFIIYVMHQRTRVDNLTICYRKKQIDVSF